MRDRCLLHFNQIDNFAAYMARFGWSRETTKGDYEVLRLAKAGQPPIVMYARATAREHVTVERQHERHVRAFIQDRRIQGLGGPVNANRGGL